MIQEITDREKEKIIRLFKERYAGFLTNEMISNSFFEGRPVKKYDIEPIAIREDGKTNYIDATIYFKDGGKPEKRFWKHFPYGFVLADRSGFKARNLFSEKNEADYLGLFGEEGYAPKLDGVLRFEYSNGKEHLATILSMERWDMNLLDFIEPYARELEEEKKTHPDSKEVFDLETIIVKIYKLAINANAYNDAIINSNEENSDMKAMLHEKISNVDEEHYRFDMETYINATLGEFFARKPDVGEEWYRKIGKKASEDTIKRIAKTLADQPNWEAIHHVRFHPEHVLVKKGLTKKDILESKPEEISLILNSFEKKERAFPYTHFAITDYRMMRTTAAFSYACFINFLPFKELDIGLNKASRDGLFRHAISVDFSLRNKQMYAVERPPLIYDLPAHLEQEAAATMFNLIVNTYALTMYFREGKMPLGTYERLMKVRVDRMKEVEGNYPVFLAIQKAYAEMVGKFNMVFGDKKRSKDDF